MKPRYSCTDYRTEMIWLALQRRCADPALPDHERRRLEAELQALEDSLAPEHPPPDTL